MTLLPLSGTFPFITLLTNFFGAVGIGLVVGLVAREGLNDSLALFLKTGVCGGFTTFSTFSLETVTLLEQSRLMAAVGYITASVFLCLAGVLAGRWLAGAL